MPDEVTVRPRASARQGCLPLLPLVTRLIREVLVDDGKHLDVAAKSRPVVPAPSVASTHTSAPPREVNAAHVHVRRDEEDDGANHGARAPDARGGSTR
jgi:hypothetical protein